MDCREIEGRNSRFSPFASLLTQIGQDSQRFGTKKNQTNIKAKYWKRKWSNKTAEEEKLKPKKCQGGDGVKKKGNNGTMMQTLEMAAKRDIQMYAHMWKER